MTPRSFQGPGKNYLSMRLYNTLELPIVCNSFGQAVNAEGDNTNNLYGRRFARYSRLTA